jgi:hypothetical protein
MKDEPSTFRKYIADSLEKEQRPAAEIKPRTSTRRTNDPKNFILDVLVSGPVPATTVQARGAERGFTRRQLRYAKERMPVVSYKDFGRNAPWFWALSQHVR